MSSYLTAVRKCHKATGSLPPEDEQEAAATLHEFQEARSSLRRTISTSRNWDELVMVFFKGGELSVTLIARLLVFLKI